MSTDYNYDDQVRRKTWANGSHVLTTYRANSFLSSFSPLPGWSHCLSHIHFSSPTKVTSPPRQFAIFTYCQKDLENTAPRIKTSFKIDAEDLVQRQKKKQWRKERRLKRFLTVVIGYLVMAWMVYLIIVTARITPKIWDPYDILGIGRVFMLHLCGK